VEGGEEITPPPRLRRGKNRKKVQEGKGIPGGVEKKKVAGKGGRSASQTEIFGAAKGRVETCTEKARRNR